MPPTFVIQPEQLELSEPSKDYFDLFVDALQGGALMPLTLSEELRPTRWVIRAKDAVRASGE